MKHAHNLYLSILVAPIAFVFGCTSMIESDSANREQIANSTTWAFLRHDPPLQDLDESDVPEFTYRVTSPLRDAQSLDRQVAHSLQSGLRKLGFEQVEGNADVYVNYRLTLEPHSSSVAVPVVANYVASHSYSPSYIVEGGEVVTRDFEEVRLEVGLREKRGRILWRGTYVGTIDAAGRLDLDGYVDELFDGLPAREHE